MFDDIIKYKFGILFISIMILWPVVSSIYLGVDAAGRFQMIISIIAVVVFGKSLFKCPTVIYVWVIWIIYNLINTHIHGFYNDTITYSKWAPVHLFCPIIALLVVYRTALLGKSHIYLAFFSLFFLYVVFGAFGLTSKESADIGIRMSNEMGNTFFNSSLLLAAFAFICYFNKIISKWWVYIAIILTIWVIFISGERKGLFCLFIIIMGSLYAIFYGKGLKSFLVIIPLLAVSYLGISVIMQHSVAGMRLFESIQSSDYSDNFFLTLMGDRAVMYYEGWITFLQNTWTGIGLTNGPSEIPELMGYPLHSEYIVQLAECGIIGSFLFLVFYFSMIKRSIYMIKYHEEKQMILVFLFTLISIIVINFATWTYDDINYFMFFGLLFAEYETGVYIEEEDEDIDELEMTV